MATKKENKVEELPEKTIVGGSAIAKRTAARLAAVQALYQVELVGGDVQEIIIEYITHRFGYELDGVAYVPADEDLFSSLCHGIHDRQEDLDVIIEESLKNRSVDKLELLVLIILRAAVFELLENQQTDAGIIVNDYVNIAHGFFDKKQPAFVNGVLDRISRDVRK